MNLALLLACLTAACDACAVPIRQPALDVTSDLAQCQRQVDRLTERLMAHDLLLANCQAQLGAQPTCGSRP